MALAGMIAADRDALICDLAETYGILDYRALPARLLATLAVGLRADSRIKMLLGGVKAPADTLLAAAMVDRLSLLVWARTKDAPKGRNRPRSILSEICGENRDSVAFPTAQAFEAAWQKGGGNHGNRTG